MQIQGRNPVLEALNAGMNIKKIIIKEGDIDPKLSSILDIAQSKKINIQYRSKRFLNKISQTPIHQGVIAIVEDIKEPSLEELLDRINENKKDAFLIYIREAQNEANIGAIIRSAEAAGCDAVLIPPKISLSPVMIRSSMGASLHIPVINYNLFQSIKYLQKQNVKVIGIEMDGDRYYHEADLRGPLMLIIGGEDRSLSKELQEKCDMVVKIPMLGKVNSLNMSVAASIVMYEKVRQG